MNNYSQSKCWMIDGKEPRAECCAAPRAACSIAEGGAFARSTRQTPANSCHMLPECAQDHQSQAKKGCHKSYPRYEEKEFKPNFRCRKFCRAGTIGGVGGAVGLIHSNIHSHQLSPALIQQPWRFHAAVLQLL
eukprot:2940819-Amphidinium_carterae.1